MRLGWLLVVAGTLSGCDTFFQVKGQLTECGSGAPIGGAAVVVMTDPGAWDGPEMETTTTDETGYFFAGLNKPMDEAATVSFSKTGFVSVSQDFPKGIPNWPFHMDLCLDAVAAGTP